MKFLLKYRCVLVAMVALSSMCLNGFQARREAREFALYWLDSDSPIVRVESDPKSTRLRQDFQQLRSEFDRFRDDLGREVRAHREYVDTFIVAPTKLLQEDLDRTKVEIKSTEQKAEAARHDLRTIVGELIKLKVLPEHFVTF